MFEARCTNGAGSWSATGFGGKGQRSLSREVGMATSVALTSGEPVLAQANPFTWAWYELPLEISINETITWYNAVVQIDSESLISVAGEDTWVTFDVIVMNGTLPGNAQTGEPGPVTAGNPYCWTNEECTHDYYITYSERARLTASFGFNHTNPGGMIGDLTNLVVGIREAGNAGGVTEYSITATRLPRVLTDGLAIETALAPCRGDDLVSCRQYFEVPVAGYDVLHVRLERTGDNITYTDAGNGAIRSYQSRGLVGDLYIGTGETHDMPPPLAYDVRRGIDNVTLEVEAGYFCTLPHEAGTYTVAVVAGDAGGFGAELITSQAELAIQAGVPRQGRGRFTLHVRHAMFEDGLMDSPLDMRPGCVTHGQTRNYTLITTGPDDANLYAEVTGGNVSAMRARCTGCDWVEATPPINALAASPCNQRNGTTWELQLRMDDVVTAPLAGLTPTEFTLSTELQNATVMPGERLMPRSEGGRGYVCCGAVQSYLLADVPRTHAPALELNVTYGHLRAVFWKYDECVRPLSGDVEGAECTGACEMTWFTVYDEFYGAMQHTQRSALAIPFGDRPWHYDASTTKRREGDWYVSIWALPDMEAEYTLDVFMQPPPRTPDLFSCSRFDGFCPRDHYHSGVYGAGMLSAASAPVGAGSGLLAVLLAVLASARMLFGGR